MSPLQAGAQLHASFLLSLKGGFSDPSGDRASQESVIAQVTHLLGAAWSHKSRNLALHLLATHP